MTKAVVAAADIIITEKVSVVADTVITTTAKTTSVVAVMVMADTAKTAVVVANTITKNLV